jgi:hypothetical protein
MALEHTKFVAASSRTAAKLLDLIGELSQENVLFNGAPNYKSAITQPILDATPGGLTVQQLADAEFAKASILTTLNGALPALAILKGLYA